MAAFRDVLRASDADLVKVFYRLKPLADNDFIKRINHAATHVDLNHAQLVCALGFNRSIRELTDILAVVGFSSYKLLSYRRNELFTTDTYRQLALDNVLDLYAGTVDDAEILAAVRELLPARLGNIEQRIGADDDPAILISYKMELHSIYAGGLATTEFAIRRIASPIGHLRALIEEIPMLVEYAVVPPGNLFFSDDLLPAEKRYLIEGGHIDQAMISNRLRNSEISEDERQMLEDFV